MAVPKYKTSKAKSRRRRSINMRISVPALVGCSNCGNMVTRHRVCPQCGYYKGKQIIEPSEMG